MTVQPNTDAVSVDDLPVRFVLRRPPHVEALRMTDENGGSCREFVGRNFSSSHGHVDGRIFSMTIRTEDGFLYARPGHWIVRLGPASSRFESTFAVLTDEAFAAMYVEMR